MISWKRPNRTCVVLGVLLIPLVLAAGPIHIGPTGFTGEVRKDHIIVTAVAKGSPAEGKLRPKDVIVEVNGRKFQGNPVHFMTAAIDESETRKAGGKMTLLLKGGKKVMITLPVLGSYSKTAPFNCEKSKKIITQLAESLMKDKNAFGSVTRTGELGLMATGDPKYIKFAASRIKTIKIDDRTVNALVQGDAGDSCGWTWGYNCIALGEYYLLTKDRSVLPDLRRFAVGLARGQDAGGTWGHRLATVKRNGRLPGYAHMNQPSLTCFMGMIIARKCGIKDTVLKQAIDKTYAYFSNYTNRGALGYGVGNGETRFFNNNGTSGSLAVCMALKWDTEGASFFSQMASTTFDDLHTGHAHTFFNPLWTSLGAHVSGKHVTREYFRRASYHFTIRRRWDGSLGSSCRVGPEAGVALLLYCLPRRKLLITGRNRLKACELTADKAREVVMMSKIDYGSKTNKELVTLSMNTRFPQIRRGADWRLIERWTRPNTRKQKHRDELKPLFERFLKSGTEKQRMLAFRQYCMFTDRGDLDAAFDSIGAILRDEKVPDKVRVMAAQTLGLYKDRAHPYYMDVVKLILKDRPDDSFGVADKTLGGAVNSICLTPFDSGLVTDKDLFYKAALKLLENKRQHTRASGAYMLVNIPAKDFHRVGDRVLHHARNNDPTYHSYHILPWVHPCIQLLARLNIREGLACIENGFKMGRYNNEVRMICGTLPFYGANALPTAKRIKEKHPRIDKIPRVGHKWGRAIKKLEADKNPRKLISFKEAMKAK